MQVVTITTATELCSGSFTAMQNDDNNNTCFEIRLAVFELCENFGIIRGSVASPNVLVARLYRKGRNPLHILD